MSATDPKPEDPTIETPEAEQPEAADKAAQAQAEPEKQPTFVDPRQARIDLLERMLAEREATLHAYIKAHKQAEADFEAFRARLERDQSREVAAARVKLVVKLLDVEDNLERTIDAAQRTGSIEGLTEGARMVHRMFRERLGELGLERVDPIGQLFDPTSMEALGMVPVQDATQDNTVVLTMRAGYRVGDQEIRPALVQVGRFLS